MKPEDHEFYDGLLQGLTEAPRTQIDEDIVKDIKKFMSETHTIEEKYDFIQNISKEPLNMISSNVGVGRITPFVQLVCDLDSMFKVIKTPASPAPIVPKEDEHVAYGWDGKPFIAKNESDRSWISIRSIANHQDEKSQERMLVDIMRYMEDLMWEGKFDVVDKFIEDFCKEDMCFQYCLTLLTCAFWAKDKLKNFEMIKEKSREVGNKEIGKKDTESCLKGLI